MYADSGFDCCIIPLKSYGRTLHRWGDIWYDLTFVDLMVSQATCHQNLIILLFCSDHFVPINPLYVISYSLKKPSCLIGSIDF
ncbi:hypothetical protein VTO42DRAFT_380 [Malbranchea cinnamomea]